MVKIGRNEPCPCGSGKKFKRCHGQQKDIQIIGMNDGTIAKILELSKKAQIEETRRKQIYGDGKAIISVEHGDHRFVAVGNELHFSKAKETKYFTDFLIGYLGSVLGRSWIEEQLKLEPVNRHQLIVWHDQAVEYRRGQVPDKSGIVCVPASGALLSELRVAYDLYLIKHNAELQSKIVARLKDQRQFQGARYELCVSSTMVTAGYEVKFEDETDGSKKHSELMANLGNGVRFSVEAKSKHRHGLLGFNLPPRRAGSDDCNISSVRQLIRQALLKSSEFPYLIFIDINIPGELTLINARRWAIEANKIVDELKYEKFPDPFPANAIIFSNDPTSTGSRMIFDKKTFWCYVCPIAIPEHEIENDEMIFKLGEAMIKRTTIPDEFPES